MQNLKLFSQHFQTDVIVNTVFGDLDLTRAAVSKAILGVAGPNLQEFVTTEAKSKAKVNDGDIVITEGGLLHSPFVYHAVTPNWDKGKGTAQKVWLRYMLILIYFFQSVSKLTDQICCLRYKSRTLIRLLR